MIFRKEKHINPLYQMEQEQIHAEGKTCELLRSAAHSRCGQTYVFDVLHQATGQREATPVGACVPAGTVDSAHPTIVLTRGRV